MHKYRQEMQKKQINDRLFREGQRHDYQVRMFLFITFTNVKQKSLLHQQLQYILTKAILQNLIARM